MVVGLLWNPAQPQLPHHYPLILLPEYLPFVVLTLVLRIDPLVVVLHLVHWLMLRHELLMVLGLLVHGLLVHGLLRVHRLLGVHGHGRGHLVVGLLVGMGRAGHLVAGPIFSLYFDAPGGMLFGEAVDDFHGFVFGATKGNKAITVFVELALRVGLLDSKWGWAYMRSGMGQYFSQASLR